MSRIKKQPQHPKLTPRDKEFLDSMAKLVAKKIIDGEPAPRKCRICGCTDDDCHRCIIKTGSPCYWVEEDLCSACVDEVKKLSKGKKQTKSKSITKSPGAVKTGYGVP